MSKSTVGGLTMLMPSRITRITAAISSMNTPALLIRDISRTPMAFTVVVNATRTTPQITAETANVGAAAVADELESAPDLRKRGLVAESDRGDRDDRGHEHHPAGEPRRGGAGEALGPVVDRTRNGVARGQLREAERHHDLADEHQRPRPPIGGAAERETEVEQLERAGQDRDVADAGREAGELSDAAVERLAVAEIGEPVVLGSAHRGTSCIRSPRTTASALVRCCARCACVPGTRPAPSDRARDRCRTA